MHKSIAQCNEVHEGGVHMPPMPPPGSATEEILYNFLHCNLYITNLSVGISLWLGELSRFHTVLRVASVLKIRNTQIVLVLQQSNFIVLRNKRNVVVFILCIALKFGAA